MQTALAKPIVAHRVEDRAASIAALYRGHRRELIRLLMRNGASPDRAEDICQEAFLRLLASPAAAMAAGQKSYLFRIAFNLAIDIGRRESRHPVSPDSDAVLGGMVDPAPAPEDVVMARQDVDRLHRAIAQVSDAAVTALAGRMRGLTFAQIAEQEGLTLKAAFDRTTRAVSTLQALMEKRRLQGDEAVSAGRKRRSPASGMPICPWTSTDRTELPRPT